MAVPAIVLTPFPSPSHFSPFLDLAHLLINNSFIVYIAGTPSTIKTIEPSFPSNPSLIYVKLPADDLPDDDDAPYHTLPLEKRRRFNHVIQNLKPSFEQWLESAIQLETPKIVSVVSDFFVDWAPHSAAKFGISGVFFHTSSIFSTSILRAFVMDYLNGGVEIENDEITLGNLPADVKLNSKQVTMCFFRQHTINEHTLHALKCEMNSFTSNWGVLFNTVEELETSYVNWICGERKAKVLPIGPIHIKHDRNNSPLIENLTISDENTHVLNWLDSKEKRSVLYVSFGTLSCLSKKQLENLVLGLKSVNTHVILRVKCQDDQTLDDILEEYEGVGDDSTRKPWLVIRDFAPQRLILSHSSVGGFMTHCGWNSVLESIANGVPMACWPMVMDQQPNSMFICDVLRIGVQFCEHIDGDPDVGKVRDAVELVMKGKEFAENVTKWKQVVREAVEDGGSSARNLEIFMEDMRRLVTNRPSTAGTTDN